MQPALEELAFQNVGCSINACSSLAQLVRNAEELRSLRLYNNMSDDAGAAAIAKVGSLLQAHATDTVKHEAITSRITLMPLQLLLEQKAQSIP